MLQHSVARRLAPQTRSRRAVVAVTFVCLAFSLSAATDPRSSATAAGATVLTGQPATPAATGVGSFAVGAFASVASPATDHRRQPRGRLPEPEPAPSRVDRAAAISSANSTTIAASSSLSSPTPSTNFTGLLDNGTVIPPDTDGAVGPSHVMTALNSQTRIQDRSGTVLSTVTTNQFWSSVLPAGSSGVFDPHVAYDPAANRWIYCVASDAENSNSSLCIAVSQTNDPTGGWNMFRFPVDPTGQLWGDYPMLGFNKDWIVVSLNMFPIFTSPNPRGQVYVFNKANLYAGSSSGTTSFNTSSIPSGLQPAVTYDNALGVEYLVRHSSSASGIIYKSAITGSPPSSPVLSIDTAKVTSTLGGWAVPGYLNGSLVGNVLPQVGTTALLDGGDARMINVVVRTINGATSIWCAQNIALPAGTSPTRMAAQWWQLDGSSGASTTVVQQGRLDDPTATATNGGRHYAYPSIAVNALGDLVVGCSRFQSTAYPSATYAFRAAGDPLGTTRGDFVYEPGQDYYDKTFGTGEERWGDYSATVVDPVNDLNFWTVQEHSVSRNFTGTDSGRWGVWWANVPAIPPVFTSLPAAQQIVPLGGTITLNANFAWANYCQWKHNGVATTTNSPSYTISNAQMSDAGWYQVVAINDMGSTTSRTIFVNVSGGQIVTWGDNSKGQTTVPVGLFGALAVSAGATHSLAIRADGTVAAWGENTFGQCNVPRSLTGVVAIAAGNSASLALKSDGTVVGWGNVTVPTGLANVVAIAADYHYLALKADGTVVGFGPDDFGQIDVPAGLSGVVALAANGNGSLALKSDGTVVAWGSNLYGQAAVPAGLANVKAVANADRSYALKTDNTVTIWGTGLDVGQTKMPNGLLGPTVITARGTGAAAVTMSAVATWGAPPPPEGLIGVITLSQGMSHFVALRDPAAPAVTSPNSTTFVAGVPGSFTVTASGAYTTSFGFRTGTVPSWLRLDSTTGVLSGTPPSAVGSPFVFQVAAVSSLGTSIQTFTLTVAAPPGMIAAWGGFYHTLMLGADGSVWGFDLTGQLIDGPLGFPMARIATGAVAIAEGALGHSLYLKQDGTLWAMGANDSGQLGDGTTNFRSSPIQIATGVIGVSAGYAHTLFIRADGSLWGMGSNQYGELGLGTVTKQLLPTLIATHVVAASAGGELSNAAHSLFVKSDGSLWAMGSNQDGQLGTGTPTFNSITTPVQVVPSGVSRVSAGAFESLFQKADGSLWGMGSDYAGALFSASPIQLAGSVTAFAADFHVMMYVQPDHTVWGAGNGSFGQFGNGVTTTIASAAQIGTDVAAVALGAYTSYFIKTDGSVWSSGSGPIGDSQLHSAPVTTAVQITAGAITAPAVPTNVAASDGSSSSAVVVNWTPPIGAGTYEIWRGTSADPATATLLARNVVISRFEDLTAAPGVTYYYFVKATNAAGTTALSTPDAGFTTNSPVFTLQPSPAAAVALTGIANFQVAASGAPAPAFQWQRQPAGTTGFVNVSDDTTFAGSSTNQLSITAPTLAMNGDLFRCVATNTNGSATSNAATLTVGTLPVINTPPGNVTANLGDTVSFTVTATGSPAPMYQWKKDGKAIANATSSTLTLANATATDAASYTVDVSNLFATITSPAAILTFQPVIASYSPATAAPNGTVTINGFGFTGATAVKFNGISAASFTVVSNSQITAVVPAMATSGVITVTTASGSDLASSSALNLSNATEPQLLNSSIRASLATGESILGSLRVEGTTAQTVLIRGLGPTLGTFGVSAWMSDPVLTLYTSNGSVAARNDDWGGSATLSSAFVAVGAIPLAPTSKDAALLVTLSPGTYTVELAGVGGSPGVALLETYAMPPTSSSPRLTYLATRLRVGVGTSVSITGFTVGGTGTTGNSTVLVRAVGSALGIRNALANPTIAVLNNTGAQIASNDNWGTNVNLTDLAAATAAVGAMPLGANDAALLLTLPAGSYTVQVAGAGGTTGVAETEIFVVDGFLDGSFAPALISPLHDQIVAAGTDATFAAPVIAKPFPVTYQWNKGSAAIPGATNPTLTVSNVQPADNGTLYSVAITNSAGTTNCPAATLTLSAAPTITSPDHVSFVLGQQNAFTVTATGNPPPGFFGTGLPPTITLNATTGVMSGTPTTYAGSPYMVTLGAFNGVTPNATQSFTLTVIAAPTITTQPSNALVNQGGAATFTVVATGSPAPTYQWSKDGNSIAGATSNTLTISNAQPTDEGTYTVVATNIQGAVSSSGATLTVNTPPQFTLQPASTAVAQGQNATFTVALSGKPAPTLQWRFGTTPLTNGTKYAGVTTATLTISNAQPSDAGTYNVVATNIITSTPSANATLTVNTAPVITTQPSVAASYLVGNSVTLVVAATGTPAPSYQWRKDGTPLPGATNASLAFSSLQLADRGAYDCVVANAVTSVTSNPVTLVIYQPPVITTPPASQTVIAGRSATFTVVVNADPAPTYQWRRNGVDIAGATSATLVLPSVTLDAAGSFTVTIANAGGTITSSAATLTVKPAAPVIVSAPPTSVTAVLGSTFLYGPIALNAYSSPATFSMSGAPAGLTVNAATGNISGVPVSPSTAGIYTITLTVTNATGSDSKTLTLNLKSPAPVITSAASASGTAGAGFTYTTVAANATSFSATGLPSGLTIDGTTGVISGTTTQAGTFTVTVTASNSTGSVTLPLVLTFASPANAPTYSGTQTPAGTAGSAFSFTPNFGAGTTTYVLTGTLPTGLAFSGTTGAITGTPTQVGTFPITVAATRSGITASVDLTLTINPAAAAPVIGFGTAGNTRSATYNVALNPTIALTATPSTGATFAAAGLPTGLTLNASTGIISGTPAVHGTFTVTVSASNTATGKGPDATLVISVGANPNAPAINSAAIVTGQVNVALTYNVTASNTPTSFMMTGDSVPGMTFDPTTGALTGTPTTAGSYHVFFTATNASDTGPAIEVVFNIAAAVSAPVVNGNSTAIAQVGQPFSYVITATNSPTAFAASPLPAWASLDTTSGLISGIPTAVTTTALTINLTASNTGGTSLPKALALTISPAPSTPTLTSALTVSGRVGNSFTYQITASDSPTSYVATGLPAGLSLASATGIISGTPTVSGTFTSTLRAANLAGLGTPALLTFTIAPVATAPSITSASAASGKVGASFGYAILATPTPITGYAMSGTLPLGLNFNSSTGAIAGTPAEAGVFTVQLTASGTGGTSAPLQFVLNIAAADAAPVITSPLVAAATVGSSFSYTITATATPPFPLAPFPAPFILDAVSLPPGLAVNPSTGVIAGTPTAVGTYTASLVGTNSAGTGAIRSLVITVQPAAAAPLITSSTAVNALAGGGFTYQITASNTPTSFEVLNEPTWMVVNGATGALSGTPLQPGTIQVGLLAANTTGSSSAVPLTITIAPSANAPVITSSRTASGRLGTAFSYQILADTTGKPVVSAYVAHGLPAGLALNSSTGAITGTPIVSGTFSIELSAINSAGSSAPVTLTLLILPAATLIIPGS